MTNFTRFSNGLNGIFKFFKIARKFHQVLEWFKLYIQNCIQANFVKCLYSGIVQLFKEQMCLNKILNILSSNTTDHVMVPNVSRSEL